MADTSNSDKYRAIVAAHIERTANELRDAAGDPLKQRLVLCRYYKQGWQQGLSMGELVDFLGVSDQCVLDKAGFDHDEFFAIMKISDSLTEEEIKGAK